MRESKQTLPGYQLLEKIMHKRTSTHDEEDFHPRNPIQGKTATNRSIILDQSGQGLANPTNTSHKQAA